MCPQPNELEAIATTEFMCWQLGTQGGEPAVLQQALESLVTSYNQVAMANVEANGDLAQVLLRKADFLTEQRELLSRREGRIKLRAVTLNNLGCLCRRKGKLHTALKLSLIHI